MDWSYNLLNVILRFRKWMKVSDTPDINKLLYSAQNRIHVTGVGLTRGMNLSYIGDQLVSAMIQVARF